MFSEKTKKGTIFVVCLNGVWKCSTENRRQYENAVRAAPETILIRAAPTAYVTNNVTIVL